MTLLDYINKHDWRYPFGSEEDTTLTVLDFERCENEEEIEWYKNLIIEEEGVEEWKLFEDYCLETERLPHLFPQKENN